jgi:hypothetical protein
MATVIRLADRLGRDKARTEARAGRSDQQRFRYPGPDTLSEVSCFPKRRRRPTDWTTGTERRAN